MNNIFKVTVINAQNWEGNYTAFIQGQTRALVDAGVWEVVEAAKTANGWAQAAFSIQQFYNQSEMLPEIGKFPLWNGTEAANIWVPRQA